MSDVVKKRDEELFSESSVQDQLRTLLRSVAAAPEQVDALSDRDVRIQALRVAEELDDLAFARARVERHVAAGNLTRARADAMSSEEMLEYSSTSSVLTMLRKQLDTPAIVRAQEATSTSAAAPPSITVEQLVAIFGGLIAQIARQQAQIDELIDERDAFLARFGASVLDRVERFAKGGRDYGGFEVSLALENESASKQDSSSESKTDAMLSTASARDTHADLKVLANHVAALGAGRKVNLDEMNRTVATVREAGRSEVRERHKGTIRIKVGKISGKASPSE